MKFGPKQRYCVLAAAIASMGISGAATAMPLDKELVGLVASHPMIKSARKSVDAAEKAIDVAKAGYLPKVNLSSDAGPERIDTSLKTDMNRFKNSLTIEQNLFAGGRTEAGVSIAEIDFASQQNSFRSVVQSTLLEGITAYMQVSRYLTLSSIAKRNEATTQRQLNLEDERVQRGGGIAVDVLQAKTRLQIAKERRVFYEQGLRDAVANYQQVFGHQPDLTAMQEADVPATRMAKTVDEAIELSHTLNPSLKEALLLSQKAQRQISLESAGMLPTLDLVGLQGREHNANAVPKRLESSLLLKLNWNLYSGNETTSRKEAATLYHESVTEREVGVVRKVDELVRNAWNQLINGRERQELLENASNISYEVMQNRKRLRDAGKETAINVLDSEVEYFSVLSNRVNATYDTKLGGYRLLAATGNLSPELLGMTDGKFAVPVKPLVLQVAEVDSEGAAPAPVPAKTESVAVPANDEGIKAVLAKWAAAWAARDVKVYLATYATNFVPKDGMPRAVWMKQRAKRLTQAEWIKVDIKDVKVEMLPGGGAKVTFVQDYASNLFSENTSKTLELAETGSGWQIVTER